MPYNYGKEYPDPKTFVLKAVPYTYDINETSVNVLRDSAMKRCRSEMRLLKEVRPHIIVLATRAVTDETDGQTIYELPFLNTDADIQRANLAMLEWFCGISQAMAVILVSEMWVSKLPTSGDTEKTRQEFREQYGRPQNDPNRLEVAALNIVSTLITPTRQLWHAPIDRPRGARPYLLPFETYPEVMRMTGLIWGIEKYLKNPYGGSKP